MLTRDKNLLHVRSRAPYFLLSGVLYDYCVQRAYVSHDIDNLSDHDPIQLELGLDLQYIGFSANIYTPRSLWEKASDLDLFNYRSAVAYLKI